MWLPKSHRFSRRLRQFTFSVVQQAFFEGKIMQLAAE